MAAQSSGRRSQETIMTKFITATIAAAALVGATLAMSGEASAKPGNGNGNHHHWHHGGVGFFVANDDYDPSCYLVKKYNNAGRPYFVEVCG
jgi:hypothetical protein